MREREEGLARRRVVVAATLSAVLVAGAPVPVLAIDEITGNSKSSAISVSTDVASEVVASPLRVADGKLALRLEEAIAIALTQNLGLRVERYSRESSRLGIAQAIGIYDLNLSAQAQATDDENPTVSALEGAEVSKVQRQSLTLGLNQLFVSGGTASVSWSNQRQETNSAFFNVNPSYFAGLDFTLSQPLLRNRGRGATERFLIEARTSDEISLQQFLTRAISTVQQVENAYWGLVEAQAQLKVAEESVVLAGQLHEQNRVRVEVGTLAPLELVQSEAGVATRQEEIIRARAAVGDAEDALRALLALARGEAWQLKIVPETDPEIERPEVELEDGLEDALRDRPELVSQQLALRNLEVETAFYRNQALPSLDLTATYGYNGVGGDLRDSTGAVIARGGWSDSLRQVSDLDFPSWSVGVVLGYPLQNRTARAQRTIAELALAKGRVTLAELEQTVLTEVRTAARALDTSAQQIDSARVTRRLAEKNLDAEQKKYENGLSTSFQVLEIQEDLTNARTREVQAVAGYRRSLAEYRRSIGQLLAAAGIDVVDRTGGEEQSH